MKGGSFMPSRDYAALLVRKAGQDEFVVQKMIDDHDSPNEVIGFHAQQSVEKRLKAVLALHGIPFRRTHDLVELIDLIKDSGIDFPDSLEEVRRLSPFAVEFRYDELPEEKEEPFDREWVRTYLHQIKMWSEMFLSRQVKPDIEG